MSNIIEEGIPMWRTRCRERQTHIIFVSMQKHMKMNYSDELNDPQINYVSAFRCAKIFLMTHVRKETKNVTHLHVQPRLFGSVRAISQEIASEGKRWTKTRRLKSRGREKLKRRGSFVETSRTWIESELNVKTTSTYSLALNIFST